MQEYKQWLPTLGAVQLLTEGQIALAEVSAAGVRVDHDYLETAYVESGKRIAAAEADLRAHPDFRKWVKRFGDRTNTASPAQLAEFVFKVLGFESKKKTEKSDRDAADEAAFSHVDHPVVKAYFAAQKTRKARDTYLADVRREMVRHDDGLWYVHPSYGLNTVSSFRSSCSAPNWQNVPNRIDWQAEMVRRCYVPRPGHQLVEIDYGQQEVRVAACYHHDPTMVNYIVDPKSDMHKDMACQIYMLEPGEVSKPARHAAKNQFVFPSFYGSYYCQCAPGLWESVVAAGVKLNGSETTVRERLASRGITERGACDPDQEPARGTFEHHLREIERDFWGNRFRVYADWKKKWVDAYQRDGGCRFLTGFVMTGPHKRNDIINYAIQGSSFHLLLWSLTPILRWLRKYKMRTKVIGQIHDCVVFDAHPAERDDVIDMARHVMTESVKSYAPWLVVPLSADPEACPVDAPWFFKYGLVKDGDGWRPADMDKYRKKHGEWEGHSCST